VAPAPRQAESPAEPKAPVQAQKELARAPAVAEATVDEGGFARAHASPSVRRFARELGVDLGRVKGSGPKERVLKEDVQSYVKTALARPGGGEAGLGLALPALPQVDFAKFGPVTTQPLSRIKKLSGANLHRNWVTIPHVTQHDEADITELEEFRKIQVEEAKKQGIRFTILCFLLKAVVVALKQHPHFNASLSADGASLVLKQYFHIGVAVDTPNGLVVPVIRDVDKKGLLELARELGEVSERMRAGKISPADLQGGCFSISSLGGLGGGHFSPIINAPEVAILGVGRSAMKPVWSGKEFTPRLMLPLSVSYDHRVIDGAQGARFIAFLASVLSDIRRLVL
jgi:pyruvate dehydrogenase E2 component (dihydrolipoamide acetyltransferase)